MTTSSNIISAATTVGATSWAPGFRAGASAGTTGILGVSTVGTGININIAVGGTLTDSVGNTWTCIAHTNNGANGNDQAIFHSRLAFAIVATSTTITIPVTGGSFTSMVVRGSAINADKVVVGTPTIHPVSPATNPQTDSGTTTNSTQVCWAWNQVFTSSSPGASYTDGHFVASLASPARGGTGSSNAVTDGFYDPAAAGTQTATCTWSNPYTGNTVVVVLDNPPPAATVPGAPTGVAATAGDSQAAVSWTAPASDGGAAITDYTIQYSSNGGTSWSTFAHAASTATSITVTGLTNGTAYIFRVAAVNSVGTGAYSTASGSVTPEATVPPVTDLIANANQVDVELSWTLPTLANPDHIEIRRADGAVAPATVTDGTEVVTLTPTTTSYDDNPVLPGTEYSYSVFMVNTDGIVSDPTSITVTTLTLVPIWTNAIGSFTLPDGTVKVKLQLTIQSAVTGGTHYVDEVGLFAGTKSDWSRGGIASAGTANVEASDDGGTTWAALRVGPSLAVPASESLAVFDGDIYNNRQYRASITTPVNNVNLTSDAGTTNPVPVPVSVFTISDPVKGDGISLSDMLTFNITSTENVAWYEPLGRSRALKLSTGIPGNKFDCSAEFFADADFQAFKAMRDRQSVMIVRTPLNEQYYVKFNEVFSWQDQPGAYDRIVTFGFTEVDWKA
jgi:hypothetical protein